MATKELRVRVKHAYLSAAEWVNNNPILQAGELGFESDTLKFKIGDGITKWSNLFYYADGIIVDKELSSTSTNPVQNKAIYNALSGKVAKATFDTIIGQLYVDLQEKVDISDLADVATSGKYTDLRGKPDCIVQSVNKVRPDENGNVTINIPTNIPTVTIEEMKAMFTVK